MDLKGHLSSRALREKAQEMEDLFKGKLKLALLDIGEEDDRGNYWWKFDEPFEAPDERTIESVEAERRAPVSLDADRVKEHLPEKFVPEVIKYRHSYVTSDPDAQVPVYDMPDYEVEEFIDEDALLALNFAGEIHDDLLKRMYVEGKITYAFKVKYA